MDSGNWPPDTQSPFPRRKWEKGLVASKGYTSLWFSLFNRRVIVLQYGELRWHHCPARNGPLLVLFNMCCWFWTRCLKYSADQGTRLPSVSVKEPSVRPEPIQRSVPPPDNRNEEILLISSCAAWNDEWCVHCILGLDWCLNGEHFTISFITWDNSPKKFTFLTLKKYLSRPVWLYFFCGKYIVKNV